MVVIGAEERRSPRQIGARQENGARQSASKRSAAVRVATAAVMSAIDQAKRARFLSRPQLAKSATCFPLRTDAGNGRAAVAARTAALHLERLFAATSNREARLLTWLFRSRCADCRAPVYQNSGGVDKYARRCHSAAASASTRDGSVLVQGQANQNQAGDSKGA